MQSALRRWQSPAGKAVQTAPDHYLLAANRNIRELIEDTAIPASVRAELADEFDEIAAISNKLRDSEIHIAAFGRVGVGKSSLLNALLGRTAFSTSPLHGETRSEARADWHSTRDGNVVLVDTPGIDELEGDQRAELAETLAEREVPHVWEGEELVVPEQIEAGVDALFDELEAEIGVHGMCGFHAAQAALEDTAHG
mgnify:CR=1 FL=1